MRTVLAALAATLLASPALAADLAPTPVQHYDRDRDHRGPGFDFRFGGGPGPEIRFGGPDFHGRFIGLGRHFWRGSWYEYGVGPCWAIGPDGRYWWVCD